MKLLLCVKETSVMVIFHPVRSWQTNPQLAQNVLLLSFGVVHCVIFSIRSLIMHVTVKTVYYILISETALSRGCVGTYVVVVLRLTNPHHHCTHFPRRFPV